MEFKLGSEFVQSAQELIAQKANAAAEARILEPNAQFMIAKAVFKSTSSAIRFSYKTGRRNKTERHPAIHIPFNH